jgi:hypothetical protein
MNKFLSRASRNIKVPAQARTTQEETASIVEQLIGVPIIKRPVMDLSARKAYDAAHGRFDVYAPGRWDATYDLVFMDPIVDGNSPGEWTGSAAYIMFKPPSSGVYALIIHFTGYQVTVHLNGPGTTTTTAYSATSSTNASVQVLFDGTSGVEMEFTLNFTGSSIGYIQSIQVFSK